MAAQPQHRNRARKVTWEDSASRLFNLVIALIDAQSPRSTTWLIRNVAGYNGKDESRTRTFRRDRAELAKLGIDIQGAPGNSLGIASTNAAEDSADDWVNEDHWWLDPDQVFLTETSFTEDEQQIIAAATQWAFTPDPSNPHNIVGNPHSLASTTARAYQKLAGTGIRRPRESVVCPVPDHTELNQTSIDAIFRALDNNLRVSFWYYRSLLAEPELRTIEPWAYGGHGGRVYLTGFDLKRQAQRTFRLSRIADVEVLAEFSKTPPPREHADSGRPMSPQDLIQLGLAGRSRMITATLEFHGDGGAELRHQAHNVRAIDGIPTAEIGPVDHDWLVNTVASYAPDVLVTEPAEAVHDVVALLEAAVATAERSQ